MLESSMTALIQIDSMGGGMCGAPTSDGVGFATKLGQSSYTLYFCTLKLIQRKPVSRINKA